MISKLHRHYAGIFGMFGALLFFVSLLIEYRYDLFPPGSGTLYLLNQIMFLVAMSCILVLLWGIRAVRAGGNGRFARTTLTIFPIGWAALVGGSLSNLISGGDDSFLVPLGAMTTMIFGLLAGIAIARGKRWPGWTRFAALLQGVTYLVLVMLVIIANQEPVLLTESLWMVTWFLLGLALFVNAEKSMRENYAY